MMGILILRLMGDMTVGNFRHGRFLVLILAVSFIHSPAVFAQGGLWRQIKQTAQEAVRETLDVARDVDDVVDSAVDDVTGYSKYNRPDYSQQSSSQPSSSTNVYTPQSNTTSSQSSTYSQPNTSSLPSTSPPASEYSSYVPAHAQAPVPSPPSKKIQSVFSGNRRAPSQH